MSATAVDCISDLRHPRIGFKIYVWHHRIRRKKAASPILLEGLRRLEYRGYDSAGVAVLDDGDLLVRKKKGKIDEGLARLLKSEPVAGNLGIGHTRWATHGPPSDDNSHPHLDQSGKIAVVHNGVIENYDALKQKLLASRPQVQIRHRHRSAGAFDRRLLRETANIAQHADESARIGNANPLTQAVCDALREVIGTYGLAVICADQPGHHRRRAARFAAHHRHRQRARIFWPATPTPSSPTRKRSFISTITTWRPSRRSASTF